MKENKIAATEFDAPRTGTGTHEWAEVTENIARGCPNACRYCYASLNAKRFKLRERNDWAREELTKRAEITSYPARGGIVMFPSAHDLTPFNLDAYLRVAKLMLESGNRLLIVSKPRLDCITRLCDELQAYRDAILLRFTIGTVDPAITAFWEPGAPAPAERVEALRLAFEQGYRTSVSAEPLLGGLETALQLLPVVRPYVTDSIWIGKMNKIRTRVEMSDPEVLHHVRRIEHAQRDEEVMAIVQALEHDPLVRWKDSFQEVMARARDRGAA